VRRKSAAVLAPPLVSEAARTDPLMCTSFPFAELNEHATVPLANLLPSALRHSRVQIDEPNCLVQIDLNSLLGPILLQASSIDANHGIYLSFGAAMIRFAWAG
jgi:hypothetical protein